MNSATDRLPGSRCAVSLRQVGFAFVRCRRRRAPLDPVARAARYPVSRMKAKNLKDLVGFSKKEPTHNALFESERLWSELVCLERSQQIGPVTDPASDA